MNSINNRPSVLEIEKAIKEITSLNLHNETIDNIKSKLKLLFTGFKVGTPLFGEGILLYRGIKFNEKPDTFSSLIYPPIEKAAIGRANRNGVQVFYCSNDKSVPFYELDAKPKQRIIISEWISQKILLVNNVGYTDSVFTDLLSSRSVPQEIILKDEVSAQDNLVKNFLATTFSQKILEDEVHLYNLTNAIAEKHFSEDNNLNIQFKALVYPTVRMQANADNFAISKLAIDSDFLKLEKVEYIEIIDIKDNIYTYKILDVAFKAINEEIKWKNIKSNWIWNSLSDLYLVEFENEVYGYDYNGNLVDSQ